VLLQAGVPLPDFVHPDDPAVLPVPASVPAFGGGLHLLGCGGEVQRQAPDRIEQQRRQWRALGPGLGGEVEEGVGADRPWLSW
jgi:hypothetical protein